VSARLPYRSTRTIGTASSATTRESGPVRELNEVGLSRGLGSAQALRLWQGSLWIHEIEKASTEGLASGGCGGASVVVGMHDIGADPSALRALAVGQGVPP